jgi:hypothetical protein|tara:strand:+ start:143 stop:304 length:162 start_codon:yes stop_codon:yes gene_type:complete
VKASQGKIVMGAAIVIALLFLIGKGVAGSLNRMTHAMKVLAECSSDIEIPAFD